MGRCVQYSAAMRRRQPIPERIRGLLHPACGPVVRVGVRSADAVVRGVAVIDTGASMSAIDKEIARSLDLPSPGAAKWFAITDTEGEHAMAPLRRASLTIAEDPRLWQLDLIEVPQLAEAIGGFTVVALLGWDFLDQCILECNGPAGTFSLTLPKLRGSGRRRR